MQRSIWILILCAGFVGTNFSAVAQTAFERDCATLADSKEKDGERLKELLKLSWDYTMRESPEFATWLC